MSCGQYVDYITLTNNLKIDWMGYYKNIHPNEELPVFIVEGINEICSQLACSINGDPLNKDTWEKVRDVATVITECIDIHNTSV